MINNTEDITKYSESGKIYIPSQYINRNYSYRFNGDYITITTNLNCRTQYNTTYCDCRQYNWKLNVISNAYECTVSTSTQVIPFESISEDINDSMYIRDRFIQDKGIYIGIFILGIILAILLTRNRSSI